MCSIDNGGAFKCLNLFKTTFYSRTFIQFYHHIRHTGYESSQILIENVQIYFRKKSNLEKKECGLKKTVVVVSAGLYVTWLKNLSIIEAFFVFFRFVHKVNELQQTGILVILTVSSVEPQMSRSGLRTEQTGFVSVQ